MKKALIILSIALLPVGFAHAEYKGPGAQPVATTIQQLLENGVDHQRVILRGQLVQETRNQHYQFSDGTRKIPVRIDSERWPTGVEINDKTTIEITGKYDKEWTISKVNVESIRLVQ